MHGPQVHSLPQLRVRLTSLALALAGSLALGGSLVLGGCHRGQSSSQPPSNGQLPAQAQQDGPSADDECTRSPLAGRKVSEHRGSRPAGKSSTVTAGRDDRQGASRLDGNQESLAMMASARIGRGGVPGRDFAIRLGIGFDASERQELERAMQTWRAATGLPLRLREGYGPSGLFHLFDELPTCRQRSVYDGLLGCYNPKTDVVSVSRPAVAFVANEDWLAPPNEGAAERRKNTLELLYVVFLHELGHWLGLGHAPEGSDSIMLADLPALLKRGAQTGVVSRRQQQLSDADIARVCSLNPCTR